MEKKVTEAIELLAGKITDNVRGDEAMRITQAMLNLAHTLITLDNIGK